MSQLTNPYAELEVAPGAAPDEVRRAYHDLARRLHPDHAGDDPQAAERLRRVNAAYDQILRPRPAPEVVYVTVDPSAAAVPAAPPRRVALKPVLAACAALCAAGALGGLAIGRSGAADLGASRKAGELAGRQAGTATARRRAYRYGLARGRAQGYEEVRISTPVDIPDTVPSD